MLNEPIDYMLEFNFAFLFVSLSPSLSLSLPLTCFLYVKLQSKHWPNQLKMRPVVMAKLAV